MKITFKYHGTATEKRHIKQLIAGGHLAGSTKIKSYVLTPVAGGYTGVVTTRQNDDWGRMSPRIKHFSVALDI